MADCRVPKFGSLLVLNPNHELDVCIDMPTKPTVFNGIGKNDKPLTLIWPLADVYICHRGENPFEPAKQVDSFEKEITFTLQVPNLLLDYLRIKDRGFEDIFPIYYQDAVEEENKKWVEFNEQDYVMDNADKMATITLSSWIKDPPIGWGGDNIE